MNSNEFNILLFGETGAGKSTTINALANYLRYDSFEAAVSGDFVQTIPSKLKLLNPTTYEPLVMEDDGLAEDSNEFHNEVGASVTQCPKSYSFEFEGKRIRVIDTPGMGDTGGIEVDKQNVRKILNHFKTMKTLNAICFLIKTNTTRKTAAFRYCVNELLSLLDRGSARTNLVFCFTFCRNSLYGPGDGYDTLKQFLHENENKGVQIEVKRGVNCFFIDNEAYHYLVARKHGYPFTENKAKSYKESWDKSSATIKQMLRHVFKLPPASLFRISVMLNARQWLPHLKEPMERLQNALTVLAISMTKLENSNQRDKGKIYQNFQNEEIQLQFELGLLISFIRKLCYYLIEHSNTTCEILIEPYLQILNTDNQIYGNNSNSTEIVNKIIDETRIKINSNQIEKSTFAEIRGLRSQIMEIEGFGSELPKILGYIALHYTGPKRPKGPAPLPPTKNGNSQHFGKPVETNGSHQTTASVHNRKSPPIPVDSINPKPNNYIPIPNLNLNNVSKFQTGESTKPQNNNQFVNTKNSTSKFLSKPNPISKLFKSIFN